MEAQSLQLSSEQLTSSASHPTTSYLNSSSADGVASTSSENNGHLVSSSSSPVSVASTAISVPVSRTGKTRSVRKTKPRTSPYPVSPTVAVAASTIGPESVQQQPHESDYSNPMMDYRYDLQQASSSSSTSTNGNNHQQQQYLTSTLYSAYNSNEVQLYSYGANGVAEAATASGSNHSAPATADLYNPYYETDNMAAAYPSTSLRHYTNLTEGEFSTNKNLNLAGILKSIMCLKRR